MNPLQGFARDEILAYAQQLVRHALMHIEMNEELSAEAAAWRLADALGALSQIVGHKTMGIYEKTGLGYKLQIDKAEDNDDT